MGNAYWVSEKKTRLEQALDLFVYAPLGLALTARDELPRLVEKGRKQFSEQMTTAKVMGEYALAEGQRDLEQRTKQVSDTLGGLVGTRRPSPAPALPRPSTWRPPATAASPVSTAVPDTGGAPAQRRRVGHPRLRRVVRFPGGAAPGRAQRDELEAVRAYESATGAARRSCTGSTSSSPGPPPKSLVEGARPANEADVDRLAELCRQAQAELSTGRGGAVFVAREAPEPMTRAWPRRCADAGIACGRGPSTTPWWVTQARVEPLRTGVNLGVIEDIYVEVEGRAIGVGEAMMGAALEWFVAEGCKGVDAYALPGDRHTKNFFEESGFGPPARDAPPLRPMTRPEVCVGAIAVDDDRLLMIRRGHGPAAGEWSVPGGRVEAGETLAEAVVRELAEETGLEGVCDDFVGWVERIGDDHHFVILDFGVTILEPEPVKAGDDAAEAAWVPLDQVVELRLVEGLAEFLHEHGILGVIT